MNGVSDGETGVTYEYLEKTGQIEHIIYQARGEQTMRTTKTYDRRLCLLNTTTRWLGDNQILSSHQYTYNMANQRTTALDDNGNQRDYEYDGIGQVISGEHTDADGNTLQSYTYDFDTIGNRKQAFNQGVVEDYNANRLNQYASRRTTENTNKTHTDYQHDEDGNLLQDGK